MCISMADKEKLNRQLETAIFIVRAGRNNGGLHEKMTDEEKRMTERLQPQQPDNRRNG